jgi:hypothetical protein
MPKLTGALTVSIGACELRTTVAASAQCSVSTALLTEQQATVLASTCTLTRHKEARTSMAQPSEARHERERALPALEGADSLGSMHIEEAVDVEHAEDAVSRRQEHPSHM